MPPPHLIGPFCPLHLQQITAVRLAGRWRPLACHAQGFWWPFSWWGRGPAGGSPLGHTILGQVSLLDALGWPVPLQMQTLLYGEKPSPIISHILIFSVAFFFWSKKGNLEAQRTPRL